MPVPDPLADLDAIRAFYPDRGFQSQDMIHLLCDEVDRLRTENDRLMHILKIKGWFDPSFT